MSFDAEHGNMNGSSPWREHTSATTGRVYYYNKNTDESTYEMPPELQKRKSLNVDDPLADMVERDLSALRERQAIPENGLSSRAAKRRREESGWDDASHSFAGREGEKEWRRECEGGAERCARREDQEDVERERARARRHTCESDRGIDRTENKDKPTFASIESNPHIRQVLQPNCGYQSLINIKFNRMLAPDAPRLKYRRRRGEEKTVIHWGQRKLFLSELEFLTMYGVPGALVVYAGAAPGTHTRYLIELFPELKFVLVDPAPFSSKLTEGPRCVLRQQLFTDDVAREFEGLGNVLFMCDIRSCDWSQMNNEEVEDKVLEDMLSQQRWHDIIRPIKSMLKFRLPWNAGKTEYLAGDVYFQAFGPITTTETRLIPYGHERVKWDNTKYEEQMFHFNTVTRVARYGHAMPVGRPGYGIDYCYDCRSEVDILEKYLLKMRPELQDDSEELQKRFVEMTYRCSRECASNRTLLDANSDPEEKSKGIRNRQWIKGKPAYHQDNVNPKPVEPVYSSKAQGMMAKMGYEGGGLGPQGQGTVEPAAESTQFRRRGLGFDPTEDIKRPVSSAAAPGPESIDATAEASAGDGDGDAPARLSAGPGLRTT